MSVSERPLRDEEWPDDPDPDPDGGAADEEPCPACGRPVYEDAVRCPHCGEWIERESLAARRGRGWRWPLLVAALIVAILVVWHGLGR